MPNDQFLVFFDEYRQVDVPALAKFLKETDPDETEEVEIQPLQEKVREPDDETRGLGLGENPLRISAYLLTLADFNLSIIVHNIPAPDQLCIEQSHLKAELKELLHSHKSFALLTLSGGEQYRPMERVVLLSKVALGLVVQGALGAGCPEGLTAIDSATFQRLAAVMQEKGESLWKSLRDEGAPSVLYANKVLIEEDGEPYILTFGNSLLRLPDVAGKVSEGMEPQEMAAVLDEITGHMLQKGPVLQAGQNVGLFNRTYLIIEPPAEQEIFSRPNGVLLLIEQTTNG